jgi:hypothetical protein
MIPDAIGLMFEIHDGDDIRVIMARNSLPAVLAEIQREVGGAGSVVPMRPEDLQLGRMIAVESTQVRPNPDGTVQLILFARLDDRGSNVRSLPLTLSPSQASGLAADLQRHAAAGASGAS